MLFVCGFLAIYSWMLGTYVLHTCWLFDFSLLKKTECQLYQAALLQVVF